MCFCGGPDKDASTLSLNFAINIEYSCPSHLIRLMLLDCFLLTGFCAKPDPGKV